MERVKLFKKTVLLIFFIFSFFAIISTVAAANYYVDNNTSHKDIANWMKNNAKNGDNLIFTGSSYDLTATLVVSKSINIKSENKTQINLKKNNSNMFNVTVSGVNFNNLFLDYNTKKDGFSEAVIYAYGSSKKINIKNTDIRVNGPVSAIDILNWYGNVSNCKINVKYGSGGISSKNWVGNLRNSEISCGKESGRAITVDNKWKGNIENSNISSYFIYSVGSIYWSGKIYGSKIYDYTKESKSNGLFLPNSKGTITNSIIKSSSGSAIGVSDNVKVSNCSLSSSKKYPNISRLRPDLSIYGVYKSGKRYEISFYNPSYVDSKACHLVIKCENKILKKISIKSIIAETPAPLETIKIAIPSKYANKKYTKTAIIDYYNKNKENNKKNNEYKFKF